LRRLKPAKVKRSGGKKAENPLVLSVGRESFNGAEGLIFAQHAKRGNYFQFWSAYVPCGAQHLDAVQLALEQIDVIKRLADLYPSYLQLVTTAKGQNHDKRTSSL